MVRHQTYNFSRDELKQFIIQHKNDMVTYDGINPINIKEMNINGVEIDSNYSSNLNNLNNLNNSNNFNSFDANIGNESLFQPSDRYKSSFDNKYNLSSNYSIHSNNPNVDSNISGNEVKFDNNNNNNCNSTFD